MASHSNLPDLVQSVRQSQRLRWQQGDRVRVESLLEQNPSLRSDTESMLELVYNEMILREELGDPPDLTEYVARFPQFADRLPALFEIHWALESQALLESLDNTGSSTIPHRLKDASWPTPVVPGYQILGVIGSGGMGIVYKARHLKLDRIVALKMISAGGVAAQAELERLQLEAEAVASLQHPGIVQVYEVGETNGLPYMALEFVDGGSLAQKLDGKPWPPAAVAQMLHRLTVAVGHAHSRGVLHRDLKPANILLARVDTAVPAAADDRSPHAVHQQWTPKLTDFGLAKRLEGEAALAQTGSIIGTPSYMAPEQARPRGAGLGPATDVYALGAVLYELLTGRPPFVGQTVLETLEQVVRDDPVHPSYLQPRVPRDLATICLKCLQKEPARRYASAADLATDLQLYLDGKPIHARPTGPFERVLKWAQRKPATAALVLLSILAMTILAAGGWWAASAMHAAADRERQQRTLADNSFRQAVAAVQAMLVEVGDIDLADIPQMEPVRQKLLLRARDFYIEFLDVRGEDASVRVQAAQAHARLGDIHGLLGDLVRGEQAYRRAIELLVDTGAEDARRELAGCYHRLGVLLRRMNRFREAEQMLLQALDLRMQFASTGREADRKDLADTWYYLGVLRAVQTGRTEEAFQSYEQALQLQEQLATEEPESLEYRRTLARTLNNRGILQRAANPSYAERSFSRAIALQEALVAHSPQVPAYRRELARSLSNKGALLWTAQQSPAAEEAYRQALTLLERLTLDYPAVPIYRHELAGVRVNLGIHLRKHQRYREAEEQLRQAQELRERLVLEHPAVAEYGSGLAQVRTNQGLLLEDLGQPGQAEAAHVAAIELLRKVVANAPAVPDHASALGAALNNYARLLVGQGRAETACTLLKESIRWQRSALDGNPAHPQFRRYLANDHALLAHARLAVGQLAAALAAAEELPRLYPESVEEHLRAAEFAAQCAAQVARDVTQLEGERRTLAEQYATRAVELLRMARSLGFKDCTELRRQPVYDVLRGRPDFQQLLREMDEQRGRAVG